MVAEGIIIETGGQVVGVAVRVHGGFMFFSSEPELNVLEATVFRRVGMITRRASEILCAKKKKPNEDRASPYSTVPAVGASGGNVVQLRPKQWHTNGDSEPPDAA
jgi:hypothetical protein